MRPNPSFCTVKKLLFLLIWFGATTATSQELFVGGTVTVLPGTNLYVGSNLTVNGSLDLKASASGYSQLKYLGTYSGTGTFTQEQYLSSGWHLIASSVSSGYNSHNGNASKLYAFSAAGANPGYALWNSGLNDANRGYYAQVASGGFLTSPGAVAVTGAPNSFAASRIIDQTAAVTSNGSANGSGLGWHLIGNPLSCGIDWFSWWSSNPSLNAAVYIWDADSLKYDATTPASAGQKIIPPLQGFWVQVNDAGGSTIPSVTQSDGTFTASAFQKQLPPRLDLVVTAVGDSARRDRAILAHIQGATLAFEGTTDAWKLSNGAGMPNLMSRDDATGQELSINALDMSAPGVIPVAFRGGIPGEKWTITADGDWAGDVLLEDRLLGTFTDLRAGAHTFAHAGWTLEESRFRLHYVPAAALGDDELAVAGNSLIAYAADEWVWVRSSGEVVLCALDGRVVARAAGADGIQRIPRPATGIYVVRAGTRACKIWVP